MIVTGPDGSVGAPPAKAVLKITVASMQAAGTQKTVTLKIENTGNGAAFSTTVNGIAVKTLTGTGTVTAMSTFPLILDQIPARTAVTQSIILNVPATVQRISLTENGVLQDPSTASAAFSASQMIIVQ